MPIADNDFETTTYKRELYQKMLNSARKKDETSKLMVRTIARTNEMNVYIFEMQVIDESDDCEDHFPSSLFQERSLRILTQNTFPSDLAYNQH